MVLLGSLLASFSLCAQTAPLKLPVAHAHFGSWCMGYLTIAPDAIRYDAVQSHGKDQHSFSLQRDQVLYLNYWVLGGQFMNAVEIRTATKIYHFWLMQNTNPDWRPVEAAASDSLLLSLYYWRVTGTVPDFAAVNTVLAQLRQEAAAAAAMAQAGFSGNGASNNVYDQLNQHNFVNSYLNSSTVNQINTINRMSHW